MSSSVIFLLVALGLSVVGSLVVWSLSHRTTRRRPDLFDASRRVVRTDTERFDPPSAIRVIDRPAERQE
jgi:hypothetical protein